jgi:hypothetical protein
MDPTVHTLGKKIRTYCDVLSEYPIATKSSFEQENVLNNHDFLIVKKSFHHELIRTGETSLDP